MKTIQSLLSYLDLDLGRISSRKRIAENLRIRQEIESWERDFALTKLIGFQGALECFSRYLALNSKEGSNLDNFLQFYANNYVHSRSQWSQDIFVAYSFQMQKHGTYLEIGGADGFTHSNTLMLRDYLGWSGTILEPDPDAFKKLEWSRGMSDKVVNAAVSTDGTVGTAQLRKAGQLSALVGHEGHDLHYNTRINSSNIESVNTVDLTSILVKMGDVNYFSLDVEGAEFLILSSIRWEEIRKPSLITVEHNFRDHDRAAILELLGNHGYSESFKEYDWIRRGDLWMAHQDFLNESRRKLLGIV